MFQNVVIFLKLKLPNLITFLLLPSFIKNAATFTTKVTTCLCGKLWWWSKVVDLYGSITLQLTTHNVEKLWQSSSSSIIATLFQEALKNKKSNHRHIVVASRSFFFFFLDLIAMISLNWKSSRQNLYCIRGIFFLIWYKG